MDSGSPSKSAAAARRVRGVLCSREPQIPHRRHFSFSNPSGESGLTEWVPGVNNLPSIVSNAGIQGSNTPTSTSNQQQQKPASPTSRETSDETDGDAQTQRVVSVELTPENEVKVFDPVSNQLMGTFSLIFWTYNLYDANAESPQATQPVSPPSPSSTALSSSVSSTSSSVSSCPSASHHVHTHSGSPSKRFSMVDFGSSPAQSRRTLRSVSVDYAEQLGLPSLELLSDEYRLVLFGLDPFGVVQWVKAVELSSAGGGDTQQQQQLKEEEEEQIVYDASKDILGPEFGWFKALLYDHEVVDTPEGPSVLYMLAVETTARSYVLRRSYSQFASLHLAIHSVLPRRVTFPGKRWLGSAMEPSFIERRKKSLAQYVNSLNAHQRELRCNDALCVFLELTSVCRAAQVGDLARTDRLLSLGRESTEQDEKGDTPLHLASLMGHLPVVSLLLEREEQAIAAWQAKQTGRHQKTDSQSPVPLSSSPSMHSLTPHSRTDSQSPALTPSPSSNTLSARKNSNSQSALTNSPASAPSSSSSSSLPSSSSSLPTSSSSSRSSLSSSVSPATNAITPPQRKLSDATNPSPAQTQTQTQARPQTPVRQKSDSQHTHAPSVTPGQPIRAASPRRVPSSLMNSPLAAASVREMRERPPRLVDLRDKSGRTALHCACLMGYTAIIKQLLQSGSSLTARCLGGLLPIHYACSEGHLECTKTLLDAGADPTVLDDDKMSCIDHAQQEGNMEVVKLLADWIDKHALPEPPKQPKSRPQSPALTSSASSSSLSPARPLSSSPSITPSSSLCPLPLSSSGWPLTHSPSPPIPRPGSSHGIGSSSIIARPASGSSISQGLAITNNHSSASASSSSSSPSLDNAVPNRSPAGSPSASRPSSSSSSCSPASAALSPSSIAVSVPDSTVSSTSSSSAAASASARPRAGSGKLLNC